MKKLRNGWYSFESVRVQTAPIVESERYDVLKKLSDPNKIRFNRYVCDLFGSVAEYHAIVRPNPFRILILDAFTLCTTRALMEQWGVPTEYIDVISRDTAFCNAGTDEHFYTEELGDWLQTSRAKPFSYGLMVLDFCCLFRNPDAKACLQVIFERQLLHGVSGLVVTFSHRDSSGVPYEHFAMDSVKLHLPKWAASGGYTLQLIRVFTNVNVFSMYFKVLNGKRVRCRRAHEWHHLTYPT